MNHLQHLRDRLQSAVQRKRLLDTAIQLISVPSRTGEGGAVADRLADILGGDGFRVERPVSDHPAAPAVVVRLDSGKPGPTLEFNGHLDTVHLPFVPPRVEGDRLTGSGSADMKAGVAAAVEALRVLRDLGLPHAGSILFVAHDLHEAPWGDNRQLDRLIRDGVVGNAVLIPEYMTDRVAVIGRGALTWKATLRRPGQPIHEVMRPPEEPSVIAAGAELVARIQHLAEHLAAKSDPLAGAESVFIGQIHSGEIYNQYPQECFVQGTRRWLPGTRREDVELSLNALFQSVSKDTGTSVNAEITFIRDAFLLDRNLPFVELFETVHEAVSGTRLPFGPKPFCDDGNTFWTLAGIPTITHGPQAGGAHTLQEWVSIDDLCRVALVYALTAASYCAPGTLAPTIG